MNAFGITVLIAIFLFTVGGCGNESGDFGERSPLRSFENQVGTRFAPIESFSFKPPEIIEIPFSSDPRSNAIWGAIGRSDQGNIYLGASARSGEDSTAFLYQYDPKSGAIEPQGDVLDQLKRAGLYKPGMGQNKLHSKFYQADDKYVYFASFDEQGEEKGINPTWGGHLWRKKESDQDWQHLLATQEALIAVNLAGNYVYALGYWDHVLYQFDTRNSNTKRVVVGSLPNHVSRNFIVDPRGHAYVPKVTMDQAGNVQSYLNEYDVNLNLVGSYPMPSYRAKHMGGHHGIVGYASMKNGDIVFTTSDGGLYELEVFSTSAEKLKYLGLMHPAGKAYIPSLFPLDGESLVAGVGRTPGKKGYEWILYEFQTGFSATYSLDAGDLPKSLLYGTQTRDDEGNFYLVGKQKGSDGEGARPVLLMISADSLW
jgi:hypothetical protein